MPIGLCHAEKCRIESSAVDEIKLRTVVNHRLAVDGGTEIESSHRHTPDNAGVHGQRNQVLHLFLGGNRPDAVGQADAEIDDAVGSKLERCAPRNNLPLVELESVERLQRNSHLARESGIVLCAIALHVVLGLRYHDAVDHDSGDPHLPGIEGSLLSDALHLTDDIPAGVLCRDRHGEIFEEQGFLLHGHITFRVCGGSADKSHIDGKRLVEKGLLSAELDELNDVVPGHLVDLSPFLARIDEGAQPDA